MHWVPIIQMSHRNRGKTCTEAITSCSPNLAAVPGAKCWACSICNYCCSHYKQYLKLLVHNIITAKQQTERKMKINCRNVLKAAIELTLNLRSLIPFSEATDLYKSKIKSLALSPMAWTATWNKLKIMPIYACISWLYKNRWHLHRKRQAPEGQLYQKRESYCTDSLYLLLAGHDWVVHQHMATKT